VAGVSKHLLGNSLRYLPSIEVEAMGKPRKRLANGLHPVKSKVFSRFPNPMARREFRLRDESVDNFGRKATVAIRPRPPPAGICSSFVLYSACLEGSGAGGL
jgi:hypothetical protein